MNHPTWRKPAGVGLLLMMIATWGVLVASVADWLTGLPWPVHALYYLVAGLAWLWILPIRPLLLWMETGRWRS